MAVTINEFEVIPEAAPAVRGDATDAGAPESDEPLSLDELDVMIQREFERVERLWAH